MNKIIMLSVLAFGMIGIPSEAGVVHLVVPQVVQKSVHVVTKPFVKPVKAVGHFVWRVIW